MEKIKHLWPIHVDVWPKPSQYCKVIGYVQSLICVPHFVTTWTAARQATLSFTISQSLLKFMSIKLVMLSNQLIFWHWWCYLTSSSSDTLFSFCLQSYPASGLFQWVDSASGGFSISPSNEYSGLISFSINWFDLLAAQGLSRVFSSTTSWKHLDLSLKAQRLYSFFRSFRNWNRINCNVHFSPILRKEKFFYLW